MIRGEIYRARHRPRERGAKQSFYVVVSRSFIAENADLSTVVCAPIYGQRIGLSTEVLVGPDEGLPQPSSIRCDFLSLVFKSDLVRFVCTLGGEKLRELDGALAIALGLPAPRA